MSIHISKKRLHRAQSPNLLDLRNPAQQKAHDEHPAVAPRHAHERPHRRVSFRFPRLRLQSVALRGLIQFMVVAVLIIVPILAGFAVAKINVIRGDVLQKTSDAYADLMDAKDNVLSLKFTDAEQSFSDAENAFSDALALLPVSERTLAVLATLPTGDFVENAYHTLVAGRTLSHAGAAAAKILAPAGAEGVQFSAGSFPTVTISEQLVAPEWQAVQDDVQTGLTHLEKIHAEALPQKYREQFSVLFDHLPLLLTAVQNVDNVQDMLRYFLGFDGRKEYIVWFQNTSELRATGGFIGSFAILTAENGTLSVIDVPGKGAYTLNDYITKKIVPPAPLQLINKDWQSQDANWWPNFPTSAEKFNEFYALARGFPVDGIIALTPKLITDLLGITGDVALDTYGIHVNAENFLSITQEKASVDYDKALNQPKQFIADLIPILFRQVLAMSSQRIPDIAAALSTSLVSRDLQLYSRDERIEQQIRDLKWSGELITAPLDSLAVIATNIGGGKTDDVMTTDMQVATRIEENADVEHTLTITRTHHGDPKDTIKGVKNMSYIRIYVPKGSTFVSADGFTTIDRNLVQTPDTNAEEDTMLNDVSGVVRIDERSGIRMNTEFGRDVFGHWIGTEAGKTQVAHITYRVPFQLKNDVPLGYSLFVQRQAGSGTPAFAQALTIPSGYRFVLPKDGPETTSLGPETIQYASTLSQDLFFGVAVDKK